MSNPNDLAQRITLCKECSNLTIIKTCSVCKCFMPAKVRLKGASCPIGKWGPYVNPVHIPNAEEVPIISGKPADISNPDVSGN